MINFIRFLTLSLMTTYASMFLAAFSCIFHDLIKGGKPPNFPPLETALNLFYPCLAGVVTLLLIASSPLGDKVMALFFTLRRKSMREDARIAPIVEHIKHLYHEKYGEYLDLDVQMMDIPTINGMAIGRKTVVVTTGLLKTGSDEEVTGVIAHEAGHLHHGDGRYNLAMGALFFLTAFLMMWPFVFIVIYEILDWIFGLRTDKQNENKKDQKEQIGPLQGLCGGLTFILVVMIIFLFPYYVCAWIITIPLRRIVDGAEFVIQWPQEYRADRFAAELGYGPAMIELFERIGDEDIRTLTGFMSKYFYSHPPTALRLDRIERELLAISVP
jgi:Zn-dependent protease with chaperone function